MASAHPADFRGYSPFLANDAIAELWGHGITDTKAVFDGDGLALYFKCYLSDVEYEDDIDAEDKPATVTKLVDGVSKQFIKGERLKYYPTGMKLFSSSRGVKRPTVEEMSNAEAMNRIGNSELVYRETYLIGAEDKGNLVDKRFYKKSGN